MAEHVLDSLYVKLTNTTNSQLQRNIQQNIPQVDNRKGSTTPARSEHELDKREKISQPVAAAPLYLDLLKPGNQVVHLAHARLVVSRQDRIWGCSLPRRLRRVPPRPISIASGRIPAFYPVYDDARQQPVLMGVPAEPDASRGVIRGEHLSENQVMRGCGGEVSAVVIPYWLPVIQGVADGCQAPALAY